MSLPRNARPFTSSGALDETVSGLVRSTPPTSRPPRNISGVPAVIAVGAPAPSLTVHGAVAPSFTRLPVATSTRTVEPRTVPSDVPV